MALLRDIRSRIGSVQSTLKITSSMKMIATVKLHKAQRQLETLLPYQRQLDWMLYNFMKSDIVLQSPYFDGRPLKRVALVLFSSNNSLCGGFNLDVVKSFLHIIGEYRKLSQDNIIIFTVGKKIDDAVKNMGFAVEKSYTHLSGEPNYDEAKELAELLMGKFVQRQADRIELIYHHYLSVAHQSLTRQNYLPMDYEEIEEEEKEEEESEKVIVNDYIVEPSISDLLDELLPQYLIQKIYTIVSDDYLAEQAARMMAMQNATDNANDLIKDLTQQYNKGRQQAITNEILDLVGGSMR